LSGSSVIHYVFNTLREYLPELELVESEAMVDDNELDIIARHGSKHLLIEIKELPQTRIRNLIGQLAAGALQAKHYAKESNAVPAVIVFAPRIGQRAMQEAHSFMDRFLPEFAWGVIDKRGRIRFLAPKLGIDIKSPFPRSNSQKSQLKDHLLFSDLNRWMLKILLLSEVDDSLWQGPRDAFFTPNQLRHVANVSLDKAYRFVRMLEKNDFLRRTPGGLRLIRLRELIDLWFSEERLRPARRIPARSILGKQPALKALVSSNSVEAISALGGFSACNALEVLHAPVDLMEVHIRVSVEAFLERFKLETCDDGSAQLRLIASKHRESIFRGAVDRDGIKVADVFQAALDVINHPARGLEQAEHIVGLILDRKAR
jgi:hypothetical protein